MHVLALAFFILLWSSWSSLIANPIRTVQTPWLRTDTGLSYLKLEQKGSLLAYSPKDGMGLNILDLRTGEVFAVTKQPVGPSFFWAPDSARLFYREQMRDKKGQISSKISAYDIVLKKNVLIEQFAAASGILTFDSRDLRMHIMHADGIRSHRLYFPNERLAFWQISQRTDFGKWLAAQNGMMWVTQQGLAMSKLEDDLSGLESFAISPDGTIAAWATNNGKIYVSRQGMKPQFLDYGRDPAWHPKRSLLAYAGARMVGPVAASYDIKVVEVDSQADTDKVGTFLTATQTSNERWPQWRPEGRQIIYAVTNTTDLFRLDFAL